jgi:hypothetical protein
MVDDKIDFIVVQKAIAKVGIDGIIEISNWYTGHWFLRL